MNGTDLLTEVIQPLALYILITFLATDVIKHIFKAFRVVLGKAAILVSVAIGGVLSYGWTLTVLPLPDHDWAIISAHVLTALIIGGAAGGIFSWLTNILPWYETIAKREP